MVRGVSFQSSRERASRCFEQGGGNVAAAVRDAERRTDQLILQPNCQVLVFQVWAFYDLCALQFPMRAIPANQRAHGLRKISCVDPAHIV